MKVKGKFYRASICLAIGIALLGAAVFANYDNANGYNKYKNAVKQVLYENNFTAELNGTVKFDDKEIFSVSYDFMADPDGEIFRYSKEVETDWIEGTTPSVRESFTTDDAEYTYSEYYYPGSDGVPNVNVFKRSSSREESWLGINGEDEQKIFDRMVRFGEVAADAFVGDIKNNFVLTGKEKGTEHYTLTLSEAQIPEIAKAGTALVVSLLESEGAVEHEDAGSEEERILYEMLNNEKEMYIDRAVCEFKLNDEDKLTENVISVIVSGYDNDGNRHDIAFVLEVKLDNYGTTVIEEPEFVKNLPPVTLQDGTVVEITDVDDMSFSISGTLEGGINFSYHNYGNLYVNIVDGKEVSAVEYGK